MFKANLYIILLQPCRIISLVVSPAINKIWSGEETRSMVMDQDAQTRLSAQACKAADEFTIHCGPEFSKLSMGGLPFN